MVQQGLFDLLSNVDFRNGQVPSGTEFDVRVRDRYHDPRYEKNAKLRLDWKNMTVPNITQGEVE